MSFEFSTTVVLTFRSTTIHTFSVFPSMLDSLIDNVSLWLVFRELVCRPRTAWKFTTIDTTSGKQTGKFGDSNTKELTREDMLQTLFKVGNLMFETFYQSFGNFSEEHTALATRVEEGGIGILKQLLRKHIDNLVGQFGRSKHLIITKIGYARQYVRIIDVVK